MSNEELVAQIQAGAAECMVTLWEQVVQLVKWKAKRVMTALELRVSPCGVEFDDLVQSGYLALVTAVEHYSPDKGAFSTWFMYHLQKEFSGITGYRTNRSRNDPLNTAYSLDIPLDAEDTESSSFGELIPDKQASANMETVEGMIYHKQLREALEDALAKLPADLRKVIDLRFYGNMTLVQAGSELGISGDRVRIKENQAIRKLRSPGIACNLVEFYDFDFYHASGYRSFQRTRASIQEQYLLVMERRENLRTQKDKKKLS